MMNTGGRIAFIVVTSFFALEGAVGQIEKTATISIVPQPVKIVRAPGEFQLDGNVTIVVDKNTPQLEPIAALLASRLRTVTGYPVTVHSSAVAGKKGAGTIIVTLDSKKKNLAKEGYELSVTKSLVKINGFDEAGVFRATQTLYQLLPEEIECNAAVRGMAWSIPCVQIEDYPRFPWRGMHLDVGRHFFPKAIILRYIDLMAMYKLNSFHWHLTEDQGWRIEIKKYPRLTEVGSWRKETMGNGLPHGGFYTQDDIREVVAYAKERFIDVVPEIEMPGHARAALASYPEFSCTGAPLEVGTVWGVEKDVFCAGNERTFEFLQNILSEVIELFPGNYIHVGGDECPKDRWKECPRCQAKIKADGLNNEHELQSYFIKRIERFLNSKGKRLMGWDEILEGGLAPYASVMSWRGTQGGIEAAKSNHDVVMTPTEYCYFDYYQSLTGEPKAIGGYLPMDVIYSYDPVPAELTPQESKRILGSQGNMWTEYMPNSKHLEYMLIPRMCALSEMVWTQQELRKYDEFLKRMESHYQRLAYRGVNFRVPTPFTLGGSTASFTDSTLSFTGMQSEGKAYYTINGEEPNRDAIPYTKPIELKNSTFIKAKTFMPNGRQSNTVSLNFSRIDSTVHGLAYILRIRGASSSSDPANWNESARGFVYSIALPKIPMDGAQLAVRFDARITIEKAGLYTFYMRADSGSILAVNNIDLITGGPADVGWWRSGRIVLDAGSYPLSILDLELDRWRGITVEYEGPGLERQTIPARFLTRK